MGTKTWVRKQTTGHLERYITKKYQWLARRKLLGVQSLSDEQVCAKVRVIQKELNWRKENERKITRE